MNLFSNALPKDKPEDIVAWSTTCGIKVDGHSFDPDRMPQLIEPLRAMTNPQVRGGTLVKPVQTGGSTIGEILLAFWAAFYYGQIQYNWPDEGAAKRRWETRVRNMLLSVHDLVWAGGRFDETICQANFVNSMILMQGVVAKGALDSETIPFQLNEEVHLWAPGLLDKARRRQSLIWNKKFMDISNAGCVGDQLEAAYEEGSMEVWENFCPGCGKYHVMQFRFDEKHPELGGLRFDTSAGRQENGKYNLAKVLPTIRYQMPCGFIVRDDITERRRLVGRYRATNPGAAETRRSWNYEAVCIPEISWSDLVMEWLKAVRALKTGDGEPMKKFVQERECKFYSPQSIPYSSETIYNVTLKKNRDGMKDRIYRAAKFDWQQGYKSKGELQHYWGVIVDVDINANSQLVWEGIVESDSELLAEIDAHEVPHCNVWIDCTGTHKKTILQLCYQNGFNALDLSLSRQTLFLHPDHVRRFYSVGRPIHRELNTPPVFQPTTRRNKKTNEREEIPNPEEPIVVSLNKAGLLANYFFIRNMKTAVLLANPKATVADYISLDIPADVSEAFKEQIESWQVVPGHRGSSKDESVDGFKPRSNNDHLLMCMAYHCFELEWKLHPNYELSLLGARLAALGIPQQENKSAPNE
jgi:Phage terminase large subunit (GpA)